MRDAWLGVEELGTDTLFNWEHFSPLYGDSEGKHFECWTLLAARDEAIERVEFGALVTCNSYRNQNLLADMARSVDHISNGKLILGMGSGWFKKDYDECGYEFGTAGRRSPCRIVAEHAHIWNGFGDSQKAARKSRVLDDWCTKVGCNPKEIERSILIRPEQIRNAEEYVANGVNHLILGCSSPNYNLAPLKELVAWRDSR